MARHRRRSPVLTLAFLRTPDDPQRPPSAPHFAAKRGEGGIAAKDAGMARNADEYTRTGGWRDTCQDTTPVFRGQMRHRLSDVKW